MLVNSSFLTEKLKMTTEQLQQIFGLALRRDLSFQVKITNFFN